MGTQTGESEKSLLEGREEVGICLEIAMQSKSHQSSIFCGDGSKKMCVFIDINLKQPAL